MEISWEICDQKKRNQELIRLQVKEINGREKKLNNYRRVFFLKEIRTTMNITMKALFKKRRKSGYTEFMEQPMKYTALQRIM